LGLPWHPFLLLLSFVTGPALANGLDLPVTGRAYAVGIAAVIAALVAGRAGLGTWHRAGLAASAVIVLITTKGTTSAILLAFRDAPLLLAALGAALLVGAYVLLPAIRNPGRHGPDARSATGALNLISFILVALVVSGGVGTGPAAAGVDPEVRPATRGERPDIYVLLLDGYPRADVLQDKWEYDNSEFISELEARGLAVSDASRSNYMTTRLSVASVLNMRPVHEIPAVEAIFRREAPTQTTLRRVISENTVFAQLRSIGYRVTATAPGIEVVSLRSADQWLEGPHLNEFEYRLLELTYLTELLRVLAADYLSAEHRGRIEFGLDAVSASAGAVKDRSAFVWGHILSPHMPPVYGAGGEPVTVPYRNDFFADAGADRDMTSAEFREAFRGHMTHFNQLILEAVDAILAKSESPPVIVLFSDHGTGAGFDFQDQEHSDIDERAGILYAALTPGRPNLFADDATPVNTFPLLFNAYFGTDYPSAPNATFIVTSAGTLQEVHLEAGAAD
jgi:hypothetical protein